MTRNLFSMLALIAAGLAFSCAGVRHDEESPAGLSSPEPAPHPSVGRAPADDDEAEESDGEEDEGEQEVIVALADVPRVVIDAARAALPGVVLTSAEMEQEDGQTVYSLEGTVDGQDVEIEVSAAGVVLEIERC